MKKAVVKVNADDPKTIMKGISKVEGHSFLSIDMNEKKLVVIGNMDSTDLVNNLRDYVPAAELVMLWPHKETEQKKINDMGKKAVVKAKADDPKSIMKGISKIEGHSFLSIDMKEQILVVIGNMDPTNLVYNFRKSVPAAELVTFGPHEEKEQKKKNDTGKNAAVKVNVDDPKYNVKGIPKIEGHSSLSMDMTEKMLVVFSNMDPIELVNIFEKYMPTKDVLMARGRSA